MRIRTTVLSVSLAALLLPAAANALMIQYAATDLTDTTSGEDLWRYDYTLSGQIFNEYQGFTVFFSPNNYGALSSPSAPNSSSDWDVLRINPDPGIPDDGLFDALALVNNASLSGTFSVQFVWLGGASTVPGAQSYETYKCNNGDCNTGFEITSGGGSLSTVSGAIPEPGSLSLFLAGLLGLGAQCFRSRQIRTML